MQARQGISRSRTGRAARRSFRRKLKCSSGKDFLPHVTHAADDESVHYALGYQGSGVSFSLYAGKFLAGRAAGHKAEDPIPPVARPLPPFPLHRFLRLGQAAAYGYFRMHDRMDRV